MVDYTFLKFVAFRNLLKWDYKRHTVEITNTLCPFVKLSKHINNETKKEKIFEFPEQEFGILGISNDIGMFDAYIEKGKNINQPYKIVKNGYIAYNPYRINVGSIGIKTKELQYQYISPAYIVISCKTSLLPEYLFLLMKGNYFHERIKDNTTGSVRQTLLFNELADIQIPLPDIHVQEQIVKKYHSTITEAEKHEKRANELEESIDKVLFEELGIKEIRKNIDTESEYKFLKFMEFRDIMNKWTYDERLATVLNALHNGKFKSEPLSKNYIFTTRAWKKRDHSNKFFNYIEIGGIDAVSGIVETSEVEVSKAPSRATQTVKTGDLIIGTTRPNLKKFAIVPKEYDGFICSSGFQVIEPSQLYNLEFLSTILKSSIVINQFEIVMTGALYPSVNQEQLKEIIVPLPPLNIQNKIVDKISAMKEEIKSHKKQAQYLRELAKQEFENEVFDEA